MQSGAVWGSVSCPRTLWHADQGNWTCNLLPTRLYPWVHSFFDERTFYCAFPHSLPGKVTPAHQNWLGQMSLLGRQWSGSGSGLRRCCSALLPIWPGGCSQYCSIYFPCREKKQSTFPIDHHYERDGCKTVNRTPTTANEVDDLSNMNSRFMETL